MHEEDGEIGLWVESPSGEIWKAFGDGRLLGADTTGKATSSNMDQCRKALEQSVHEVRNAFHTGNDIHPADFAAWQHAPVLEKISQDPKNHTPLLKVENGKIFKRAKGADSGDFDEVNSIDDWLVFYTENFSRVEGQVRLIVQKVRESFGIK